MFDKSPVKIVSKLGLIYCIFQLILRFFFLIISKADISWSLPDLLRTIFYGLAFDISVVLLLLYPLFFFLQFFGSKLKNKRWSYKTYKFLTWCFFTNLVFTTVSEYFFWEEFHTRFNFIAVDYLVYTNELVKNIVQAYPVGPLLIVVFGISTWMTWYFVHHTPLTIDKNTWTQKIKLFCVYCSAMAICIAVMNAKMTSQVSSNRYNQEISGNGIFQLFYAFFNNELDYNRFYLHKDDKVVLKQIQDKLALDGSVLLDKSNIKRHKSALVKKENTKPNIVVITVESLSASFTGLIDKQNSLTPYLDKLAEKSFTFDRVYATGTRTVRGLEAISLSLPPTPGQSIVRREESNNLYNISTPFKSQGYKTQFVYGGYGYFDNMNDFFRSNDFEIFDRTDIPKDDIYFETVWGVADEILFKHAIKQMDEKVAQGPVMQLILTTTNHSPYTFPEGTIDAPQKNRESVVKYTDWAINKFIEEAKTKPWFDNTVFVIIADHNARVAGRVGLPVSNYHIPCVVYAPKLIEPGKNNRLMSQIDVMPTVLGMLGIDYDAQHMGYDMNKLPIGKERVFIATYQEIGYIADDKLIILQPGNKVSAYKIDNYATNEYTSITPPKEMVDDAIAWYQGASYLYKNKLLKVK